MHRLAGLLAVVLMAAACASAAPPPTGLAAATGGPVAAQPSSAPETGGQPAASPSASTAPPVGPPFPDPASGQRVYDDAGAFTPETIAKTEATIAAIEKRIGAQVVVYTQVKPGADSASTEADALALMDQWGVGRKGIDDGLVILWNFDESRKHGQIQLYAGPGFRNIVSDERRQSIYEKDMVPLLASGDIDGAMLVGMTRLEAAVLVTPSPMPTATPRNAPSQPPTGTSGWTRVTSPWLGYSIALPGDRWGFYGHVNRTESQQPYDMFQGAVSPAGGDMMLMVFCDRLAAGNTPPPIRADVNADGVPMTANVPPLSETGGTTFFGGGVKGDEVCSLMADTSNTEASQRFFRAVLTTFRFPPEDFVEPTPSPSSPLSPDQLPPVVEPLPLPS